MYCPSWCVGSTGHRQRSQTWRAFCKYSITKHLYPPSANITKRLYSPSANILVQNVCILLLQIFYYKTFVFPTKRLYPPSANILLQMYPPFANILLQMYPPFANILLQNVCLPLLQIFYYKTFVFPCCKYSIRKRLYPPSANILLQKTFLL